MNWENNFHHGIYKFTPLWLEYTSKNGKTLNRKANISNYRSVGEKYALENQDKKAVIRIGDPYSSVSVGEKKYIIKYTYDMGTDPYRGFDEMIFHAYGDYWGTIINNASIEVNMPKSIEGYDIKFFTDKYRKNDVTNIVDYSVNGNKLYATFNENKNKLKNYEPLSKSLTVDIALPEGYFTKGSYNYGWWSISMSIIIFILTLWTIFKWFKYGKDYEKRAQTVEFYPPDNLDAAQIGYIYNEYQYSDKLTIALVIELASKGYIKIDEIEDENIKITNMIVKPKFLNTDISPLLLEKQIVVQKLKDIDDKLNKNEVEVMTKLFLDSDRKMLDNNYEEFLKVKDKLVSEGYIKIINIKDEQKKEMKEYEENIAKYPPLSSLEKIVYEKLFIDNDEIILSNHPTFYEVFYDVSTKLKEEFKEKVYDLNSRKYIFGGIKRGIVILFLSFISYIMFKDLDPRWNIIYYLAFACNFINIFFVIYMERRTKYGEYILAKVCGFKNFLEMVEKEQLEALVLEKPEYFYDILPYTYVLDISKKWISKFENISYSRIDMGSFDYGDDSFYSKMYHNVTFPETDYSFSSGCSSGGGFSSGSSSGGGGCSSCGGGGSW